MTTSQREPPEDTDVLSKKLDALLDRTNALISSNELFLEELDI